MLTIIVIILCIVFAPILIPVALICLMGALVFGVFIFFIGLVKTYPIMIGIAGLMFWMISMLPESEVV